jgi:hypothetical protein
MTSFADRVKSQQSKLAGDAAAAAAKEAVDQARYRAEAAQREVLLRPYRDAWA